MHIIKKGAYAARSNKLVGKVDRMHVISRLSALVLTLALFVTSGFAGSFVYLCRMDGEVHKFCCCENPEAGTSGVCAQVKPMCCCEVKLEKDEPPPAALAHKTLELDLTTLSVIPSTLHLEDLSPNPASLPLIKPLPPLLDTSRPIYLQVCSYLI